MASKNGIVEVESTRSFEETFRKLESEVSSREITIFSRIDFSGDALKAGLKMRPTRLSIFGNLKAGTPLMVASPSIALDVPLKILVSEDGQGKVKLSYNSPQYLKERHSIPEELLRNISCNRPNRGSYGKGLEADSLSQILPLWSPSSMGGSCSDTYTCPACQT